MTVIEKDSTYPFDVDATLIMEAQADESGAIQIDYYGELVWRKPHIEHIRLVRASVARGRNVVVWSGNGQIWASTVLKALKLDHLDILVMSKPCGYCDDLDCNMWMGNRTYIEQK